MILAMNKLANIFKLNKLTLNYFSKFILKFSPSIISNLPKYSDTLIT